MTYSVAKNTSFLTIASIGQKIISFVYFTVIARLIGVENTGMYFFALTFTSIFAVVADFGLANVLTREASKSPEKTQSIFSSIFGGKLIFGALAYLLVIFFVNILNYPETTKYLIYLAGFTMWLDNLHSLFYAVFRAKRNLKYESFGIVASQFITLFIGSLALYFKLPLIWLIGAYTCASVFNVFYSSFFAVKVCLIRIKATLSIESCREFFNMAWPFALAGVIGRLYSYSDSLLMSKILTERELGWWSVPYKIVFAFQFIPLALSASVYPVFSALFLSDRNALAKLFEKSWRYLFTLVFPLAIGIFAISGPFIIMVYGKNYAPSVVPLRILAFSLVFSYLALLSGTFLNAIGQQRKQTIIMAIVLVINVTFNLILLPKIGINGAAISALIGNFVLWLLGFIFVRSYVAINGKMIFGYFIRSLVPSLFMGVLVFWLGQKINFIYTIPIGVAVYVILLFITGGLNKEIILEIRHKLFGKNLYENTTNNT